jgi:dienelactone hydrolase
VSLYIFCDMLWPDSFFKSIALPPLGEIAILLLAFTGLLISLARTPGRSLQARYALGGVALVLDLAFVVWILAPGTANYVAPPPALPAAAVSDPALTDPGLPGPYTVQSLTYGSGRDQRRPEFGPAAGLVTQPVDGSKIFAGYGGLSGRYHRWYWGFDFTRLPLNGLVWYPVPAAPGEAGPFPLVLIVHGNHRMTEPSDPGYAYLGQHLASHGYIAVSVDENFLNGLLFIDGNMAEMPLRAWLLLKHLQQWQVWQATPGNPFYGQVDLARVALIGHSRGGEAVAHAAEMNWRTYQPVSAVSTAGDFGFGIRGVVAIAPSDDHYQPTGSPLTLRHSSYLLLAGGHDADTFTLYGQAQYNRVRFDDNPDGFKAVAYIYRANHGQFNSVWADQDRGPINSLLLNRKPLLNGQEQRQAAKVLITAFLHAALARPEDGSRPNYRALFANPAVAAAWLPDDIIVTQYEAGSFIAVDTNRPNSQPERIDVPGGLALAENMTIWQSRTLALRDGQTSQRNSALHLAWAAGRNPVYHIDLPGEAVAGWGLTPQHSLTFALTTVLDEPAPIQVTVAVETAGGAIARLPLSQAGPLYPPLPAHLLKAEWLGPLPGYNITLASPYERVLQTYTLPLSAFQATNPRFQPGQLRAIRFVFDGATAGAVYLDQVGFDLP